MCMLPEPANETTQPAATTAPIPPRYWWLKRGVVAFFLYLAVLGVIRWRWGVYADDRLQSRVDAYRQRGEPVFIEDFQRPRLPDERNGVVLLREAFGLINEPAAPAAKLSDGDYAPAFLAEHIDALRKQAGENAAVVDAVRAARELPETGWGLRFTSPAINLTLPDLSLMRTLAKHLATTAHVRHFDGNDAETVELLHDVLDISGRLAEMDGFVISTLVAVAIDALATWSIENFAPELRVEIGGAAPDDGVPAKRERVEALIAQLLDDEKLHESLRRGLIGERSSLIDTFTLAANGRLPGWLAMGGGAGTPLPNSPFAWVDRPMVILDLCHALDYMSQLVQAAACKTYPAARAKLPAWGVPTTGPQSMTRTMSAVLMPSLERAIQLWFRVLAERRMAAVALALRLYELDHGAWPKTLDALVPEYLPELPADPFGADGRTFGFLPDADAPRLYSVGVDCADEGGKFNLDWRGAVDKESGDKPFFLRGDRPQPAE